MAAEGSYSGALYAHTPLGRGGQAAHTRGCQHSAVAWRACLAQRPRTHCVRTVACLELDAVGAAAKPRLLPAGVCSWRTRHAHVSLTQATKLEERVMNGHLANNNHTKQLYIRRVCVRRAPRLVSTTWRLWILVRPCSSVSARVAVQAAQLRW